MNLAQTSGKTLEEAIRLAMIQLDATKEEIEYTILDEGSKGFLGFGAKEIKIEAKKVISKKNKSTEKSTEKTKNSAETKVKPPTRTLKSKSSLKSTVEKTAPNVAETFVTELLDKMGIDCRLSMEYDHEEIKINISGENLAHLIGKHGQTLDALQYLTNLTVNRNSEKYIRVNIDIEGYRDKRKEALESLAFRLASRVRKSRKSIVLEPMNPYERRIVHSCMHKEMNIGTRSEGSDPNRRIVIYFDNKKKNK